MALEINITTTLTATKSGTTVTGSQTKQNTLTGVGLYANVQAIGTSAELITFPADLTTEGVTYLYYKNLDATNFVQIALDNFTNIFTKLLAGESAVLKSHAANPGHYAKADTAAVNLQVVAVGT